MSSAIANSSWSRYLLAPIMLSVLIGVPVASMAAHQYGVSWWAAFLAVSGGLALFWDLAINREANERAPLASKSDPVFGPLHCYEDGVWEAQERVHLEGAWIPLAVEAGQEGPSESQHEAYREFLRDPASFRLEMIKGLSAREGESTHPGLIPISMFMPEVEGEGPTLQIEIRVDGDEVGPHNEIVGFQGGRAIWGTPEPVAADKVA